MNSKVVFIKNSQVYTMNADGSQQVQITTGAPKASPKLSPDGSRIAFIENNQLKLMNASGGGAIALTPAPYSQYLGVLSFTWSPDASHLVAHINRVIQVGSSFKSEDGLWKIGVSQSYRQKITSTLDLEDMFPMQDWNDFSGLAYSPDGRYLAFGHRGNNNDGISKLDMNNLDQAPQLIQDVILPAGTISWSSNGQNILFDTADVFGNFDVYRVSSTGGSPTLLISGARAAHWLTDDSGFVYTQDGDIKLANTSGGYLDTLVSNGGSATLVNSTRVTKNNICEPKSSNPIHLLDGDKRLTETDIEVSSPAQPLALTRYYRQFKQADPNLQIVGNGWTHNHHMVLYLTENTGAPNTIIVHKEDGQDLYFTETAVDSYLYNGDEGLRSTIEWVSANSQFVLIQHDRSQYVFESVGGVYRLIKRVWPNGEEWDYTYTSNQLTEVTDDYGRKLVFRYYTSGDHSGLLYRVGDHTFDDTNPSNPSGRYTEYSYVSGKTINGMGQVIDDGGLLSQVRDVNGFDWAYEYHLNTDAAQDLGRLNYIYRRKSPVNGSTVHTLEEMSYVLSGEEKITNGDMELDAHWADVGTPTTNSRVDNTSPHQVFNGVYARHVDAGSGEGIESDTWDMQDGLTYLLVARVYPVSGVAKLNVAGVPDLTRTSTITGGWETFYGIYTATSDQSNLTMQFLADGGAAEFYVDSVELFETDGSISQIQQERGDSLLSNQFNFSPNGYRLTEEITAQKTRKHRFNYGDVYLGMEQPDTSYQSQMTGLDYRTRSNVDGNNQETTMEWQDGKNLIAVNDPLGNKTQFDYDLVTDLLTSITDAEGRKTEYTYDTVTYPDLRQPTIVKIKDASNSLLQMQEFAYDSKGRTTSEKEIDPSDETTVLRETNRSFYTSGNGNGLLEKVTIKDQDLLNDQETTYTYDSIGRVIQVQQNSTFGSCEISYTVYDDVGHVVASICNYDVGVGSAPTDASEAAALYSAANPNKNQVTTYEYDALGRRVKTTSNAGSSFAKTTVVVYDALSRVTRQIANYVDNSYATPENWVFEDGVWKDGAGGTNISHGPDLDENIISRTEYNTRGLLRLTQDHLGVVTLYGYDDADRLVKTIQNANDTGYNNDYLGIASDPDLSEYMESNISTSVDVITEQTYDGAGNIIKTIDPVGRITYTVYDALNRPVKVVANAKETATLDFDELDENYDETLDPRSSNYDISPDPDRDQVSTTEYDAFGRVIRTQRLLDKYGTTETWDTMLYGYDALGRQIKTIAHASVPDYDMSDSSLSSYTGDPSESDSTDVDIITENVYNVEGQVSYTKDSLGRETHYGYDGLQRQMISVANFNDNAYDPLTDWAWDGTTDNRWEDSTQAIDFGSDNDENIISYTQYDDSSYVTFTRDVDGRVTRFVYDELGRQIRTIQNYVAQGASDPKDWVWNTDHWEDGAGTDIDHGINDDINLISDTVYDAQGRVQFTSDNLGNVTLNGYDNANRRIKVVQNASNPAYDVDADPDLSAYMVGLTVDQDRVSTTVYDVAGRVQQTTGTNGNISYFVYDELGRQIRTVQNYIVQGSTTPADWLWYAVDKRWEDGYGNAIIHTSDFDENLITETVYDKSGQVTASRDARGTQTTFVYDNSGRRIRVTQAAGTGVASTSHTCFDKAGRMLRMIANWQDDGTNPDERDSSGNWIFDPMNHGRNNDENLLTQYTYDKASRRTTVINSNGDDNQTTYFKDGTVDTVTDPEGMVTAYRYDGLRRRMRVIQNFVDNSEDPENWIWSSTQWTQMDGTPAISHGTNNDQNIIVDVDYDILGRMTQLRDPRGNVTSYEYDTLGRRTKLTNPLNKEWMTAYANVGNVTQTTMTYPGINGGTSYTIERDFDRMGRLTEINYFDLTNTPTVQFSYDSDGNRQKMTEVGSSATMREKTYGYDELGRLTSVGFDTDGSGTPDETVSYAYDVGGNRTSLTLDGQTIAYSYDEKGRLISMTDWDSNVSTFAYDNVNRHISTMRQDGFRSHYQYDVGSRLKRLRHHKSSDTIGLFEYETDKRGNRTQAVEVLRTANANRVSRTYAYNHADIDFNGTWSDSGSFKVTDTWSDSFAVQVYGDEITLTYGTGDDHSIFDVYINQTLYNSYDGYSPSNGEQSISIPLSTEGLHLVEVKNRHERHTFAQDGSDKDIYRMRFKTLVVEGHETVMQTIDYTYDNTQRLLSANYSGGDRIHTFTYDLAGNRLEEDLSGTGVINKLTEYEYNNANQISQMRVDGGSWTGFTYDNNGNLTDDGVNSYTWDRGNRLLEMDTGTPAELTAYAYDGLNNRISQAIGTTSPVVTQYLLDTQPSLAKVIGATVGGNTDRFIHAARGIHSVENSSGSWRYALQDGLGSVRAEVDNLGAVQASQDFTPYLMPMNISGSFEMPFGATGEQLDETGLLYLRARYMNPTMGGFLSLDPASGTIKRPMSLNGYSWVEGNVINLTDPSGLCPELDLFPYSNPEYRNFKCMELQEILNSPNTPAWEDVFACYDCAIDSVIPSVEGYRQGLEQAVRDGLADSSRAEYAIREFEKTFGIPEYALESSSIITSGTLQGNGYSEGWSSTLAFRYGNATGGREIVYNFATFERAEFKFGGIGANNPQGNPVQSRKLDDVKQGFSAGINHYVGYIAGFKNPDVCKRGRQFEQFFSQYEGESWVGSAGGAYYVGGAVSHFQSPPSVPAENAIRGQAINLSAGKGVFLGVNSLWYGATHAYRKSYMDYVDGSIDIHALQADIRSGDGSPLGLWIPLYIQALGLAREQAAQAALERALIYNAERQSCNSSVSSSQIYRLTGISLTC